jgi:predicted DNA-binding WGR domain protein
LEAGTAHLLGSAHRRLAAAAFAPIVVPDALSPINHRLVPHRIDLEQGVRRFYSLMIERDLFGTIRLVHHWGRIGANGQELVKVFDSEIEARGHSRPWPGPSGGGVIGICEAPP